MLMSTSNPNVPDFRMLPCTSLHSQRLGEIATSTRWASAPRRSTMS
jgi:hypothetical protein